MNNYYHLISLESGRVMAQLDIETIEQLPIKQSINQDIIVGLVDKIISLNNELSKIDSEDKRVLIQSEIEKIDREIEIQICQIYGISDKEILI